MTTTRPCFLYHLIGPDGEVRYVGITRNPEKRWAQHQRKNNRVGGWVRAMIEAGTPPAMVVRGEIEGDHEEAERQEIRHLWCAGQPVLNVSHLHDLRQSEYVTLAMIDARGNKTTKRMHFSEMDEIHFLQAVQWEKHKATRHIHRANQLAMACGRTTGKEMTIPFPNIKRA